MKLGRRQLDLLLEALRRYTRFGIRDKESLTGAWTGLGSMSTYAPCLNAGLMVCATSPNPGYSTWWRLTEKGARIVQAWLEAGYDYANVEAGWNYWQIRHGYKPEEYTGIIGISPESFFPEKGNRATFDEEKGVFV